MIKSILLMGSTGFIGKNIYNNLSKNKSLKIFRYSSKLNTFIDKVTLEKFDILIFASGVHKASDYQNNDIFLESKNNIKILYNFMHKVEKVIFISSFKTSFNKSQNIIKDSTKYDFYNNDSLYGKSKILAEKIFLRLCKIKKKKYTILSPTHVIGPEDKLNSINNLEIKKIYQKKIFFYPDCLISLIDVRNISYFIESIIFSESYDNQKIICNDKSLKYIDYIKIIKNKKIFLYFKLNKYLLKLIYSMQKYLLNFKIIKKEMINKSQISYIDLNPIIETSYYTKQISFDETMTDIKKLL